MKYLLSLVFSTCSIYAFCCVCATTTNFCSYTENEEEESVFMIKMTSDFYSDSSGFRKIYDVKIIDHLFGPDLDMDSISIVYQSSDCEYDIEFFADTMILKKSTFDIDSSFRHPGHTFWLCQNNFLEYENGTVRGNLETDNGADEQSWNEMTFDRFMEWYPNCAAIINTKETEVLAEIDVFPNPTTDIANLINNSASAISFQLVNSLGQTVESGTLNPSSQSKLNLRNLESGVYYLRLEDGLRQDVRKILKQ